VQFVNRVGYFLGGRRGGRVDTEAQRRGAHLVAQEVAQDLSAGNAGDGGIGEHRREIAASENRRLQRREVTDHGGERWRVESA
jgi:hypothetical protein